MADSLVTARLRYAWPGKLLQVENLRPHDSRAAFLDWQVEGGAVDSGVPEKLAEAIAAALVRIGPVAFRWSGAAPWPADQATTIRAPKQGIARAAVERISGRSQSDLVLTNHAAIALALFDYAWELQGQAALVFDARQNLNEQTRSELATRDDWRDFKIVYPALVLLAPAVDGDGMLFATGSDMTLKSMTDALRVSLADANIPIDSDNGS